MPSTETPIRKVVDAMKRIMIDPKASNKELLMAAMTIIRVTKRHSAFRRAMKPKIDAWGGEKAGDNGLERLMEKVEGNKMGGVQ